MHSLSTCTVRISRDDSGTSWPTRTHSWFSNTAAHLCASSGQRTRSSTSFMTLCYHFLCVWGVFAVRDGVKEYECSCALLCFVPFMQQHFLWSSMVFSHEWMPTAWRTSVQSRCHNTVSKPKTKTNWKLKELLGCDGFRDRERKEKKGRND